MNYRIVILICSLVLCIGCGHRHDERLQKVAEIVSDKPEEALSRLAGINADELSRRDRVYYDFLTVKGRDKAFITHTSDSLIKIVLDYAEQHKDAGFYPEVLYYGGRVYSDLGDYPTALRYFQSALALLPSDASNIILRRNVLNQTARLLDDLRLFNEAIPLVEQTLEINRHLKDTTAIVYDLQFLGHIYIRKAEYQHAKRCFDEALDRSKNLPTPFRAKSLMYLSAIRYNLGDSISALRYIRNIPDSVAPLVRNSALAQAALVYQSMGIIDTAYNYAYELVHSKDPLNKRIGYQVILSPQVMRKCSLEEMNQYIGEYRNLLEDLFNENESNLAINQQSYYNYQLHDRDKRTAEMKSRKRKFLLEGSILVILCLIISVLHIKNKNKLRIIELHEALNNIEKLKKELGVLTNKLMSEKQPNANFIPETSMDNTHGLTSLSTEKELRNRLKSELLQLYEQSKNQIEVSSVILQSNVYNNLQELIAKRKCINEQDSLWQELEEVVLRCSPNFKENLILLTLGNLSIHDWHTSLLIKCGIQPSQMALLFSKTKAAMVSRRNSLCIKIFDDNMGTKVIDAIIRLL